MPEPLARTPDGYLLPTGHVIVRSLHGAVLEKTTGRYVGDPCVTA